MLLTEKPLGGGEGAKKTEKILTPQFHLLNYKTLCIDVKSSQIIHKEG